MAPKKSTGKQWKLKADDVADSVDGSIATLAELAELRRQVAQYKEREEDLTDRIKGWFRRGGRTVGMASNQVVVTCRPTATFQERAFADDRPDLYAAFTVEVTVTRFDRAAFAEQHPDLYREYCSRQLKINEGAIAALLASQPVEPAAEASVMNPTTHAGWMYR